MSDNFDTDRPGSDRQWWLTEGVECCFACEKDVHAELLGFCDRCDRAVCTQCQDYSVPAGPVLCPECAAELKEEQC